MLPEVNTSNPNFQVFQSSVVGSMQEAEARRKEKEPTRLKKIKETKNKDEYSSTTKDSVEKKEEKEFVEPLSEEEKKKRQRHAANHANNQYAQSAYDNQQNLEESMEEKHTKPMIEI